MNKDYEYYERKVRDLLVENSVLRQQLVGSSRHQSTISPQALLDLHSKNERLERQAYKYEKSIKEDLSTYLVESMVQGECYYKDRYNKMLSQSRNHYKLYL